MSHYTKKDLPHLKKTRDLAIKRLSVNKAEVKKLNKRIADDEHTAAFWGGVIMQIEDEVKDEVQAS